MDNNDFNQIPRPRYINEYKSFRNILSMKRSGEKTYVDKLLLQIFISLVIAAVVLLLNNVNMRITTSIMNELKNALNWQIDIREQIGGIGDIRKLMPKGGEILEGILPSEFEGELTYIMPIDGEITSSYGERVHPVFKTVKMHNGIDIDAEYGFPIKAAISGKVEEVAEDETFGKYIIISRDNIKTVYAHCSKIIVEKGTKINQGDIIAEVGDTGITTGPHLHFEIWEDNKPIDPLSKIN
jgi:murein DD-endopeptidase